MDQLNMFQEMYDDLPIWKKPLKLGTFFSGIGAPEGALKDIGIDVKLQFFSEIDKYAIQAYCEIHDVDESLGVGSISDLKGIDLPYCDMWFGGFPCQDISLAGNGKGFDIESGSRSSLGWEMIRLASEVKVKPKYIVFENVAAIFNNTHRPILNLFKRDLEDLGYTLYNKLLNAKHFGSPQNRNRYFLVAILGKYNYDFPKPIKLELRLKDLLEDEVDEKYYLSDKQIDQISSWNAQQEPLERMERTEREQISPTLLARGQEDLHSGIILIKEATKKGYAEAHNGDGIYLDRPHQKRGVVQKGMTPTIKCSGDDIGVVVKGNYSPSGHNAARIVDEKGIAPTVMENHGTVTAVEVESNRFFEQAFKTMKNNDVKFGDTINAFNENVDTSGCSPTITTRPEGFKTAILPITNDLRIRKLTPKECYRLQAFSDEDYDKAASVISNAQLYKTAGNSINRNVLKALFTNLLKGGTK